MVWSIHSHFQTSKYAHLQWPWLHTITMHFYEGHAAPLYISHAVTESFPYLFTVITIYLFCFQCVQNVRKLREENMSDDNSNPQSNSSDTYKKLLKKRMYNLQEKVVPSRSSASLYHNPRQFNLHSKNEKLNKEKPKTFDKKSMDEFSNSRETDRARPRRDTSIIQASRRGDYTTILLPHWIPLCL